MNFESAERTIELLREAGKLSDLNEVRAEAVLSMASALDADPQNAALWRVYTAALDSLLAEGGESTDSTVDIFAIMHSKVRNPENT